MQIQEDDPDCFADLPMASTVEDEDMKRVKKGVLCVIILGLAISFKV